MANTDKISVLAQYMVDKLKAGAGAFTPAVPNLGSGVPAVFYGDQSLIPVTPALCVESGTRDRDLASTGFASTNTFLVYIMAYHGKVQDTQLNKKECDQFAESVETLLHTDKQMGGLLYNGWVQQIDPGIAVRNGELLRVSRLTWFGQSKTII